MEAYARGITCRVEFPHATLSCVNWPFTLHEHPTIRGNLDLEIFLVGQIVLADMYRFCQPQTVDSVLSFTFWLCQCWFCLYSLMVQVKLIYVLPSP